jgi:hypothetical protein
MYGGAIKYVFSTASPGLPKVALEITVSGISCVGALREALWFRAVHFVGSLS